MIKYCHPFILDVKNWASGDQYVHVLGYKGEYLQSYMKMSYVKQSSWFKKMRSERKTQ